MGDNERDLNLHWLECFLFFKIFSLFIFRERGREGESEGEKHQCMVASHVAPTRDLACTPGMCPDWESNWRPFGSLPVLNPLNYTGQGKCFLKYKADRVIFFCSKPSNSFQ